MTISVHVPSFSSTQGPPAILSLAVMQARTPMTASTCLMALTACTSTLGHVATTGCGTHASSITATGGSVWVLLSICPKIQPVFKVRFCISWVSSSICCASESSFAIACMTKVCPSCCQFVMVKLKGMSCVLASNTGQAPRQRGGQLHCMPGLQ